MPLLEGSGTRPSPFAYRVYYRREMHAWERRHEHRKREMHGRWGDKRKKETNGRNWGAREGEQRGRENQERESDVNAMGRRAAGVKELKR